MKLYKLLLLSFLVLLTSCSYISKASFSQNKDKSYLSARSIPPLQVPPGLSSDGFRNTYPISNKQYPREIEDVSILPPGL